ncbi:MAG: hypothetical protein V7651_12915 [Hyphomonas oceanitis]|uniref:hypothetical protein n=1 Tax=Hyphomonas oceanitis TaxID=81033 RepID=UPI0030031DEC
MIRFAWNQAGYLVEGLHRSFALGLTGCRPFLLRPVRARLAAELARFEPLVRRLLFLMALELGALPPRAQTNLTSKSGGAKHSAPESCRFLRKPRFRIAEPPKRAVHSLPPRRVASTGPGFRYLDLPLPPPAPFAYPPQPTDILPAKPLIQRLRALNDVFENPLFYITAMRRRLGQPQAPAPVRADTPPAFRSRARSTLERENLSGLQAEIAALVPHLNSS